MAQEDPVPRSDCDMTPRPVGDENGIVARGVRGQPMDRLHFSLLVVEGVRVVDGGYPQGSQDVKVRGQGGEEDSDQYEPPQRS